MNSATRDTMIGILFCLMGFFSFSVLDTTAKWLATTYSVRQILLSNAIIGVGAIIILAPYFGSYRQLLRPVGLKKHLIRGGLIAVTGIINVTAFRHLQLAEFYSFAFTAPLFLLILGRFWLKEHVTFLRWITISLGFCGVLVILSPAELLDGSVPIHSLLVIGSAMCFAVTSVLVKLIQRHAGKQHLLSFAIYPLLCQLIVLPFWDDNVAFILPKGEDIFLFILAAVCLIFGLIMMPLALKRLPANASGAFHYSQMIWGVMFGYFIFGDIPPLRTALGAVIIIAAGLTVAIRVKRRKEVLAIQS